MQRRRRVVHVGHQRLDAGTSVEGHLTRQKLERHDPQRVNIGARRHRVAQDLLGRHVLGRAHEQTFLGQVFGVFRGELLHQTEIEHLQGEFFSLRRYDDIRGLHVPVDHP